MSSPAVQSSKLVRSSYVANSTNPNSPKRKLCTITPPNNHSSPALFDTACTDTSLKLSGIDARSLLKLQPSNLTLRTAKPNVAIKSIGKIQMQIGTFDAKAHVFKDNDLDQNLIALADITNSPNNAECRFHKDRLGIFDTTCKCGNLLAFYPKHSQSRTWSTTFDMPSTNRAAAAIRSQSSYDFVMLYHAIFGSPAASTFYRAVKNGCIVIDGLSPRKVHQNWPNSLATAEGHLQRTRRNLRSTRPKDANFGKPQPNHADYIDDDDLSVSEEFYIRTFSRKDAAFIDATGRYPEPSFDGFEYQLIFVYKNYIHIELLPDRSAQAYVRAYTDAFAFFAALKHVIKNVVLDNETSAALENHLTKNDVKFQMVPPNNKR